MEEWSSLCRCCLSPGSDVSLFSDDQQVRSKFYEITSIEAKDDDGLPQRLCAECLNVMNAAHDFRKQCIRVDTELKQQLAEITDLAAVQAVDLQGPEAGAVEQSKRGGGEEAIEAEGKTAEIEQRTDTRGEEDETNSETEKGNNNTILKEQPLNIMDEDGTIAFVDKLIKSEPLDESDDDCYYVLVIDDTKEVDPSVQVKTEPSEPQELNPVTGELEFEKSVDSFLISKPTQAEGRQKLLQNNSHPLEVQFSEDENSQEYIFESQDTNESEDNSQIALAEVTDIDIQDSVSILPALTSDNAGNIIKVYRGDNDILKSLKGKTSDEIVRLITENQLISGESDGLSQDDVIVCEGDESQFQIVNYDGSELVIEYTDEGQITVIQQEDGTFLCSCGVQFNDLSEYASHQWTHNQNENHLCTLCGKGFESSEILSGHMLLHTQQGPHIRCPFCQTWIKRNSLTQHIKYGHNNIKPRCHLCLKTFANPNNLKRHMMIHTGFRQYECDICFKRFHQKITMQTHRLTHQDQYQFTCTTCDLPFATKEDLLEHQEKHECERATEILMARSEIKTVDHFGTLCYACGICNKMFSVESALQQHINNTHMQDPMELLCSECGEVLPNRKAMYAHTLLHKSVKRIGKRFICKMCGKGCASQAMLTMHERVHTNERPFPCPLCALRFKTKTHLRTHHLTHTREKKFGCSVCMKFFALKGNLVVHLRTHTGERPYVCSLCGDAFIDSKYLKKHKLRKHAIGNVPWNQY